MFAFIFDSAGFGEWFVLLAVVLVVVGPHRLPGMMRQLGRFYAKMKRVAEAFQREMMAMENEIKNAGETAADEVNEAVDAFRIDGDEGAAVPSEDRVDGD